MYKKNDFINNIIIFHENYNLFSKIIPQKY